MAESSPGEGKGSLRKAARRAARRNALEKRLRQEAVLGTAVPTTPERQELADAVRELALPALDRQRQSQIVEPSLPPIILPHQGPSTSSAEWNKLHRKFLRLARDEKRQQRGEGRDRYLHASVSHRHEGGVSNDWYVYEGLEEIRPRFTLLATHAGVALGSRQDPKPLDFWLRHLFLDLLENKSKHLRFARDKGDDGIIERVCEASALYCLRLEKEAVEKSAPLRERQYVLGTTKSVSASRTKAGFTGLSKAEMRGRRRAKVVASLIKELNALRPQMQVPEEDFPELLKQNPEYQVFKICKKHPSAATWVKRLPDRRSTNSLAYEIAAIECGVSAATIETAWKDYKPKPGGWSR